jgi:hypothetical protein
LIIKAVDGCSLSLERAILHPSFSETKHRVNQLIIIVRLLLFLLINCLIPQDSNDVEGPSKSAIDSAAVDAAWAKSYIS